MVWSGRSRWPARAPAIDVSANHHTQAVLLLTVHLGRPTSDAHKPLSPGEWGRLAQWLRDQGSLPENLLFDEPERVLEGWRDRTVTIERVRSLLRRSAMLGLAMEKWERAGLWVVTRADGEYPERLKRLLGAESPPYFFGCGDRRLLNQGGLAVVGSRNATPEDLAFASQLGGEAARQGFGVVSGGARGVDEAAMLGALGNEGTAVGVLADGLLRAATSTKYRTGLMSNSVALVSPFNPEAGFDVGNAMSRNKYIYCLADAAVVVDASEGTGGTWQGAVENLRRGWVPLWVKRQTEDRPGNMALVEQGAQWLPEGGVDVSSLSTPVPRAGAARVEGQLALGLFAESPATNRAS